MVNTSDSGSRGRGFEPHSGRRVVSLSKTYLPPKVLVIHRKRWLRPNMTENLFTGTLSIKKTCGFKSSIWISREKLASPFYSCLVYRLNHISMASFLWNMGKQNSPQNAASHLGLICWLTLFSSKTDYYSRYPK